MGEPGGRYEYFPRYSQELILCDEDDDLDRFDFAWVWQKMIADRSAERKFVVRLLAVLRMTARYLRRLKPAKIRQSLSEPVRLSLRVFPAFFGSLSHFTVLSAFVSRMPFDVFAVPKPEIGLLDSCADPSSFRVSFLPAPGVLRHIRAALSVASRATIARGRERTPEERHAGLE